MMFAHNFVLAVKVDGKILREDKNLVTLPFGSEYSLLLKNLESRRAQAKITVDGVDATDGGRLVIAPNDSLELERFIHQGNWSEGNRFRFIERTEQIEEHRGIGAEDGLVRVEFWIEKEIPRPPKLEYYKGPSPRTRMSMSGSTRSRSLGGQQVNSTRGDYRGGIQGQSMSRSFDSMFDVGEATATMDSASNAISDAGITVPGSYSGQRFQLVAGFPVEAQSHVICLQLRGEILGEPVIKAVTTRHIRECKVCGTKHKGARAKFCSQCSTALDII
jgi:hypothetical protein